MPQNDMRETLLQVIHEQSPKNPIDSSLFTNSVLSETSKRLDLHKSGKDQEQALLTLFHDLFRTGYLAWGNDLNNPDPPRFHITDRGRSLLSNLSRDPGNPDGYKTYLKAKSKLNPITESYIEEAIQCYIFDSYKAAAVMVGAASESLILELRDTLVDSFINSGITPDEKLNHWMIKTVHTKIYALLINEKGKLPNKLYEEFEANWPAFLHQIRSSRNDAGHPLSINPITRELIYGSLLIFPELARLQMNLIDWAKTNFNPKQN